MRLALVVAALVATLTSCVSSPLQREVDAALVELLACPDLAGGRIGVLVVDGRDDVVLAETKVNRGFAPASNNKLLTSAIALQTLGPDHRLRTTLVARGGIDAGRLEGNLHLVGGGDPTFAERARADGQWQAFAQALREIGIEQVAGRVIGDGSLLGEEVRGHGWQWDYLADDYAAPFGGLCAAGSVLEVRISPDGDGAKVELWPDVQRPEQWVSCEVVRGADEAGSDVTVRRPLGRQRILVTGVMGQKASPSSHRIAVADPVRFSAAVATAGLASAGITIDGAEVPPAVGNPSPVQVASIESPRLAEIVESLLKVSNNLYAEQLFRVAARTATGDGTSPAARSHAATVLAELGVDVRGLVMADGSGLSRRNLVSPAQLVAVLRAVQRAPWREAFTAGLPIAGQSGTLSTRFAAGPANGRVRAKTGFIARVVCLSGFVPRPEGEPLVFSVMLNDFTCETAGATAAVDRFVQRLAAAVGW